MILFLSLACSPSAPPPSAAPEPTPDVEPAAAGEVAPPSPTEVTPPLTGTTGTTEPTGAPAPTGAAPTAVGTQSATPGPVTPLASPASTPATTTTTTTTTTTGTPAATPAEAPPTAVAPPAGPVRYALDAAASSLYVQVYKDPTTLAANLSHDHVMVASGWSGTVSWDAANLSACAVDVRVPVSGLQVDPPDWRKRVGYDTVLDDGQRAEVRDHMLDASQLDGSKFTEMRFVSSGCTQSGEKVKVAGNLTIHGVSHAVAPLLTVSATPGAFSASGSLTIRASEYGFKAFSAMMGALKNKDDMKLTLNVKGHP